MKTALFTELVIAVTMLTSVGFAQETTFSRQDLIEDLEQLWETVQEHPKPYAFTSKSEYEALYASIETRLVDGMTSDDFIRVAYPLAERLGCAHSTLWPPLDDIMDPKGTTVPLEIRFSDGEAYVARSYPESAIPRGSELVAINNVAMSDISETLLDYIPCEGRNIVVLKESILSLMFCTFYPVFFETTGTYGISYHAPGRKETENITLAPVDTKTIWTAQMERKNQAPLDIEYDEGLNAASIRIKTFYFNGDNDAYNEFIDTTFAEIRNRKIPNVILDLRGNGGGDPVAAAHLFSYIAPEPVKYFAVGFNEGYGPLAEPIQLAEDHFEGHLYTLIDGGGFSTAGHIVSLIKYHGIGTIIGSEHGSTYTCNDASVFVTLEHTKNTAKVARTTYATAVEGMRADQGVLPDVPVPFSARDFAEGLDTTMNVAIDLVRKSR